MSCIIIKSTEINKALEEETWGKKKQREAMREKKTLAGGLSFLRLKNVSGDVANFFPAVVTKGRMITKLRQTVKIFSFILKLETIDIGNDSLYNILSL